MGLFKKYRQKIRMVKSLRKYYRRGNRLTLVGADGNKIVNPKYFTGLKIKSCGTGNDITIELPINIEKYLILVLTDNTTVRIGRNTRFGEPSNICKSRGTAPNHVYIGRNCGIGQCTIDITDHGNVEIGNDCMFSWGIVFKTDDTHAVFDATTGAILNKSTGISVGNNVWIGMNATILKNSVVPDHTIVGAHSVVAGKFRDQYTVVAGNPARRFAIMHPQSLVCCIHCDFANGADKAFVFCCCAAA